MKKMKTRNLNYLNHLISAFPSSQTEIKLRTPKPFSQIRNDLVEIIRLNLLTKEAKLNLSPFSKVLDTNPIQDDLISLWQDPDCDKENNKENIMAALFHTEKGQEIFENLSHEEKIEVSGPWIAPMVSLYAQGEFFPKMAIASLFVTTPEVFHPLLKTKIDESIQLFNADEGIYSLIQ